MAKPELEPVITIPGGAEGILTERVPVSRVEGDIATPPSFELTGGEKCIDLLRKGKRIREVLANGGRAFITEADDVLLVSPKKPTL